MGKKSVGMGLILCVLFLAFSCTPERNGNHSSPRRSSSGVNSQANKSPDPTNSPPPRSQNDSVFSEIDNQMSVEELRDRLNEVKAIEQESRRMVVLRQNWEAGVAECMGIMKRLKPRAKAVRDEYKRMLSPAGMEIAGAAFNLVGCVNCVENDDDSDCRLARQAISKAERELKKEMRQNKDAKWREK